MLKRYFFILVLCLFSSSVFLKAEVDSRIRIAILPFFARGEMDKDVTEQITENFTIAMININKYSVVERRLLNKVLNELKFQKDDLFDEDTVVEIGKLAGSQMVVVGTVSEIDYNYFVTVRGIDVKTGVIAFARKENCRKRIDLFPLIDKLVESIANDRSSTESSDIGNFKNSNKRK